MVGQLVELQTVQTDGGLQKGDGAQQLGVLLRQQLRVRRTVAQRVTLRDGPEHGSQYHRGRSCEVGW